MTKFLMPGRNCLKTKLIAKLLRIPKSSQKEAI